MSSISDWQYLISIHDERCLAINMAPPIVEMLFSKITAKQLFVVTTKESRRTKADQDYLTVTAETSKLPFKNKRFGLVICGIQDRLNIHDIYNSLNNKGTIFLVFNRKKNHLAVNRNKIKSYFTDIRRYFAVPSFENPWFIFPADDTNVIRYFILNMMSSRLKHRRIAINLLRLITFLDLHPLLLKLLPCKVIIGKKAGLA